MNNLLADLELRLAGAIRQFWAARGLFGEGVRSGKHLDGFLELIESVLEASGLNRAHIYWRNKTVLPGWYRATKGWDLLVVTDKKLVAAIEFKSMVGSVSNNVNNRAEEVVGGATDFWAAYQEGAFAPSGRPWVGFVMILGDADDLKNAVRVEEPHFPVFPEFRNATYAARYDSLFTKLVRTRLYDAACFLTTSSSDAAQGVCTAPNPELNFHTFLTSLLSRAIAVAQLQPPGPRVPPKIEAGNG